MIISGSVHECPCFPHIDSVDSGVRIANVALQLDVVSSHIQL